MAITFPTGASVGQIYSEGDSSWSYNGSAWQKAPKGENFLSDSAPSSPFVGQVWVDTATGQIYYYTPDNKWAQIHSGGVGTGIISTNISEAMALGGGTVPTRNEVEKIAFASNTTGTSHGNLSTDRVGGVAGSDGSQTMILWGTDGTSENTGIEMKQFASDAISTTVGTADSNYIRTGAAGDSNTESLIATGGQLGGSSSTDCFRYSFATAAEYTHGDLYQARRHHAATANSSDLFMNSGLGATGSAALQSVEIMQIVANTISHTVNTLNPAVGQQPALCNNGSHVLTVGGLTSTSPESISNWQKTSFGNPVDYTSWGSLQFSRYNIEATADMNEAMIAGGNNQSGTVYANVEKQSFLDNSQAVTHGALSVVRNNHNLTAGG